MSGETSLLTMKLVFPGCILSSASTQMAFVSFTDWYNMSCPSTLRLAIVNTLLFLSFCDTVSAAQPTLNDV